MNQTELRELLDFAVSAARHAGYITLKHFRRLPKVERKADKSFVTVADRETESFLRRAISEKFPGDAIHGEEEGEQCGSSDRNWIIDPIDGTYTFVHGVPLYGVMLGLEVAGEPALG